MKAAFKCIYRLALGLFIFCGSVETYLQVKDSTYVRAIAFDVITEAHAQTSKQKVLAIRDYLRRHVRYNGAPIEDRPFFRATAAETLQDQLGYCGEVSRAFICMSDAVGVNAQRLNLFGRQIHVVAEADLGPDGLVVVDCQSPPAIHNLESLDKVMQRPEYNDYSTLNLRRLGLDRMFSRVKLQVGGSVTYFLERPHALKAALWFSLAIGILLCETLRWLGHRFLHWKGWVHISNTRRINELASSVQREDANRDLDSTG